MILLCSDGVEMENGQYKDEHTTLVSALMVLDLLRLKWSCVELNNPWQQV